MSGVISFSGIMIGYTAIALGLYFAFRAIKLL
jgi:hypothetical protein